MGSPKAENIVSKLLEHPQVAWDVAHILRVMNFAGPWHPIEGNQISDGMARGCIPLQMGGNRAVDITKHHNNPDVWVIAWNHEIIERGKTTMERVDGKMTLYEVMRYVDEQLRDRGFTLVPGENDP